MFSIRWGHRVIGLTSPTENSLVKFAYEGAMRLCGESVNKKDTRNFRRHHKGKVSRDYSTIFKKQCKLLCTPFVAGAHHVPQIKGLATG